VRRRRFLAAALALAASRAGAQPAGAPRIGFLDPSPSPSSRGRVQQLRAGLKSLGYQEGRHYVLEYRSAEGRFECLPDLAAELVKLAVRVIVARNTPGMNAARTATETIPIVMADVGDPLALGFVRSLQRPGGNITGLSNATIELLRKRLELLGELIPGLSRVAILGNPNDQNTPLQLREVGQAAKSMRLETRVFDARSVEGLPAVLDEVAAWKPQGMLPLVQPLRPAMTPAMVQWGLRTRIPVIFAAYDDARAGGLMSYAADLSDQYLRVALYIDRLLKGADAASLPVERPTRVVLSVNLRTARATGVAVPRSLLVRADEVIE
jgi:putative tryptophan/tyrosine transport system substrate-binding protein